MRFEIRTLSRAISTLVVLCVLLLGTGLNASARQRGRDWGRSHNRGNHYGWTRGRRVGQYRRDNLIMRRMARRDRRAERRTLRRERRIERRSDWRTNRYRQSGTWRRRN